ncbi:Uncharacterised protein [uncultured Clostridium sp.]|nr:Uncharacterised protein [uncultured Clostridium sp.]DAZ31264.1 MAG TPA: hypothetical protein [Caudoviricetes sp.]
MTIDYKAENRKAMVQAISEFTGVKAKYLGMPSAAYQIDYFTVTKEGNLEFDDRADSEEIGNLIEHLAGQGFLAETKQEETEEPTGLTVSMPLDKVAVGNLTRLLDAKDSLIRKALGITDTRIEISEDKVSFPWFETIPSPEELDAYTKFIAALCEMSVKAKRVTAKKKEVDNDKYAFRCFLLRLGFIGAEFKAERKILLQNLTGSAAFKSGAKKGGDAE